MNNTYDIFSKFYDDYILNTAPNLHLDYFNLIKMIIERFSVKVTSILDLTCGTGILMKILEENGFNNVDGIDISLGMLQKAKQKGLRVYRKNIKGFDLKRKYDLIVSFDSFGHINDEKDLSIILNNVSNHLNSDGLFLCDGGTREKANRMIDQKFTYDSDKYSFIWNNYGKDSSVKVEMNIVEKLTGREYEEKFDLTGHDIEDVIEAAKESKLNVVFATLEPLVKKNGSFIICFKKGRC